MVMHRRTVVQYVQTDIHNVNYQALPLDFIDIFNIDAIAIHVGINIHIFGFSPFSTDRVI